MSTYTGFEIAIIGISGRFPGADHVDAYWENLKSGVESIQTLDEKELVDEGEETSLLDDPSYVRANAYLSNKEYFDASFFGYTPDEARLMDPQMRILHECVWHAIEDAGYDVSTYKQKIGLFTGASSNLNWQNFARLENRQKLVDDFSIRFLSDINFSNSRIAYRMNLRGPVVSINTACSTSLVTVHQACNSLILGECSMAVAGGITITNYAKKGYLHQEGMILSQDGKCRAFDKNASGTVGSEGVGIVVLKRLKRAIKDNDHIYAIIKGSGINNDGKQKVGYTAPSVYGQAEVIMMARKMAKVPPESISYVEAHGTGTKLGDPVEVEGLNRAFGNSAKKYCALGSVKTNMGHLDSAAGIAGLIKAVLSLKNRQIPPSLNFQEPNSNIDFSNSPFYINTQLKDWTNSDYPLRAGVSSFGIGGTNAHVVLEEAPQPSPTSKSRNYQLLLFSAKSKAALEANINEFGHFIKQNDGLNLPDISYTLQVGRESFAFRKFMVCSDKQELLSELSTNNNLHKASLHKESALVIFMFSGQGSQYVNMCYDLYKEEPKFRRELDKCFHIIAQITGKDFKKIIFSPDGLNGKNELNQTHFTQPALFAIEYALAQLLIFWGIKPHKVIGHSVGEFVAACISEVFTVEDALRLIIKRGQMMQSLETGSMLSISVSEGDIASILKDHDKISLAAVNSPELCVVSGSHEEIDAFQKVLDHRGLKNKKIHTSHAFHSHMMDEMLEDFGQEVKKVRIHPPKIPIISNLTGREISYEEISDSQYWVNHLRKTVRFADGISYLLTNEHAVFLEIGPGKALSSFVLSHHEKSKTHVVRNTVRHPKERENDVKYLLSSLGKLWQNGIELNWEQFYVDEKRARVSLPTYSFEKRAYPVLVDSFQMISDMISEDSWEKQKEIEKWYYLPSWKLAPLLSKADKKEGSTLIFSDSYGVSDSLADRLLKEGEELVRVVIGTHFLKESESSYQLNPGKEEDFVSLFQDLSAAGIQPDRIIHAWAITQGEENSTENGALISKMDRFYYSLVYAIKAAQEHGGILGKQIQVLSSGLHGIIAKEESDPYKGIVLGLLKVIPQEYPSVISKHIDIATSEIGSDKLKDLLYEEIADGQSGKVVAISHGQRWEQIYERTPIQETQDIIPIKESGVYLLTGGLGELGYTLSMSLVSDYRAKVILLGRSKLGPRSAWGELLADEAVSEKKKDRIRKLMKLEEMGGEVSYVAGNIANREDISKAIGIAEEKYGGIHGVIHAAGVVDGRSINALTKLEKEDYALQFEPKIQGLAALREALKGKELDFCLLTSSLSTVLGGLGFSAYASANAYMDYYIQSYKAEGELQNWISVNVDGVNFEEDVKDFIASHEVFEVIRRALLYKNQPQVIVSAVDLSKRLEKWVQMAHVAEGEPEAASQQEEIKDLQALRPDLSSTEASLLQLWQNFFGKAELEIEDNFFEIGGDSLKALTMIERIFKKFKVEIEINTFFEQSTVKSLSQLIDNSKSVEPGTNSSLLKTIKKVEKRDYYLASSAQERLLYEQIANEESLNNNLYEVFFINDLDIDKLKRSFQMLIDRHEAFRTYFIFEEDNIKQFIKEKVEFELHMVDADKYPRVESAFDDFMKPFDLSECPLLKCGLYQHPEKGNILFVITHHIVCDGISLDLLMNEFITIYSGDELAPVEIRYIDYAYWQRSNSKVLISQKAYWKEQLSGDLPEITLPINQDRDTINIYQGNKESLKLSAEEARLIKKKVIEANVSDYMFMLSIYFILLHKISGEDDIIIGTDAVGRSQNAFKKIVGTFINVIPLRIHISEGATFSTFLEQVKRCVLEGIKNQDFQYEQMYNLVDLGTKQSIVDVYFSYMNFFENSKEIQALGFIPMVLEKAEITTRYELELNLAESNGEFSLNFLYSSDLYDKDTIRLLMSYYHRILLKVLNDDFVRIEEIELEAPELYTI